METVPKWGPDDEPDETDLRLLSGPEDEPDEKGDDDSVEDLFTGLD